MTWEFFVKKSLFYSLFSSESYVFYHWNSSFLKNYLLWLYIVEIQWFGVALKWYGIRSKPSLNAESLSYIVSRTLACACIHMYEYACMKHAYTKLEHACTYTCMHTHVLGFSWSHFSKNSLFNKKISYIFHKYFLQVNFDLIKP